MTDAEFWVQLIVGVLLGTGLAQAIKEFLLRYVSPRPACGTKGCQAQIEAQTGVPAKEEPVKTDG